jgi:hypothetical protein
MTNNTYGNEVTKIDNRGCRSVAHLDPVRDVHILAQSASDSGTTLWVKHECILSLESLTDGLEGRSRSRKSATLSKATINEGVLRSLALANIVVALDGGTLGALGRREDSDLGVWSTLDRVRSSLSRRRHVCVDTMAQVRRHVVDGGRQDATTK